MARMKFICDAERCIECNGCVTACKTENDVPWGVNRRRVVTLNDGVPGEKIDLGRLHALLGRAVHGGVPGRLLLPHRRRRGAARQGPVHRLRLLLLRLPVRRAAVPAGTAPSACAARWTSAPSAPAARRPTAREAEFKKYGRNRLAEGKLPACAEMCSTKALLGGDGDVVADIYRDARARRAARAPRSGAGARPTGSRRKRGAGAAPHRRRRQVVMRRLAMLLRGRRCSASPAAAKSSRVPSRPSRPARPGQARHAAPGTTSRSPTGRNGPRATATSWEEQIKTRQLAQNEYVRIYQ